VQKQTQVGVSVFRGNGCSTGRPPFLHTSRADFAAWIVAEVRHGQQSGVCGTVRRVVDMTLCESVHSEVTTLPEPCMTDIRVDAMSGAIKQSH
jgi:hypothetical protein